MAAGKKIPAKEFNIDYKTMEKTDLVFRIMTFEHIPEDLARKKTKKTVPRHFRALRDRSEPAPRRLQAQGGTEASVRPWVSEVSRQCLGSV